MTVGALQLRQIGGLQAPALPMQLGVIPAQTTTFQTTDWMSQIMPVMMMMMVMVMMVKMMGGITGIAETAKKTAKGLW